jgi:hypothetical protein
MKLMMYIGNDHIESVSLDKEKISKPGYLGTFKRNLKVKYKDLISEHGSPADFIVINMSEDANKTSVTENGTQSSSPRYQQF